MSEWLKENALHVILIACLTVVALYWISNSYRLAEVRAEVEKVKAVEGRKFKFGTADDSKRSE